MNLTVVLEVPDELRFLLPLGRRTERVSVPAVPTDTIGRVVQAAGIPLTEVGALVLDGQPVAAATRTRGGVLSLTPIDRPQPTPTWPPSFLLDVHLGKLARQLRILGLDTAYETDADDRELVARAVAEQRVLLTQDRGLLRRRALMAGALVRGSRPADQLIDVLDRFAPPLAPWTRCPRCNGVLAPTTLDAVTAQLEPGTRRSYRDFAQCRDCAQVYWPGAHRTRLDRLIERAYEVVRRRTGLSSQDHAG